LKDAVLFVTQMMRIFIDCLGFLKQAFGFGELVMGFLGDELWFWEVAV